METGQVHSPDSTPALTHARPCVHAGLIQSLYAATLLSWPITETIEFWRRYAHPDMPEGAPEDEQYRQLWRGSSDVPFTYLISVLAGLEEKLGQAGQTPEEFVAEHLAQVNRGLAAPPSVLLKVCSGLLREILTHADLREFMVDRLPDFAQTLVPSLVVRFESRRVDGDERIDTVAMTLPEVVDGESGDAALMAVVERWCRELVRVSPRFLGLEPFEDVAPVSGVPSDPDGSIRMQIRYRIQSCHLSDAMVSQVLCEALEGGVVETTVESRHQALLSMVRRTTSITYYAADESISVNGRHLMRSVPAKMLRKMVAAYVATGRQDFEYREFSRDMSLPLDPASPNISVRMQRIQQVLDSSMTGVVVRRVGRGKIRLESDSPVVYEEG